MRRVEVVAYDPAWPAMFEREAAVLREVFGDEVVAIHHMGSTAVPNLRAKPIVDIMLVVADIERVDAYNPQMEALGYEPRGEFGLPRRRYFPKDVDGMRVFQVHTWQAGDIEVERHLAFRDYLRAHPETAVAYGNLKTELAAKYATDREKYMDGKDPFIRDLERVALAWSRGEADPGEPRS